MELDTLKALYIEELKDLYSAENQILKALPRMIKAASHKELKKAFTTHERQTREHVKRLEPILDEMVADGLVTLEKVRVLKYKPGAPRR